MPDLTSTTRDPADPARSSLANSAEGTPFALLKVAQIALKVEAQWLSPGYQPRRLQRQAGDRIAKLEVVLGDQHLMEMLDREITIAVPIQPTHPTNLSRIRPTRRDPAEAGGRAARPRPRHRSASKGDETAGQRRPANHPPPRLRSNAGESAPARPRTGSRKHPIAPVDVACATPRTGSEHSGHLTR